MCSKLTSSGPHRRRMSSIMSDIMSGIMSGIMAAQAQTRTHAYTCAPARMYACVCLCSVPAPTPRGVRCCRPLATCVKTSLNFPIFCGVLLETEQRTLSRLGLRGSVAVSMK